MIRWMIVFVCWLPLVVWAEPDGELVDGPGHRCDELECERWEVCWGDIDEVAGCCRCDVTAERAICQHEPPAER